MLTAGPPFQRKIVKRDFNLSRFIISFFRDCATLQPKFCGGGEELDTGPFNVETVPLEIMDFAENRGGTMFLYVANCEKDKKYKN